MKLEITNDNIMNYSKLISTISTKGKKARAVAKFNKILAPLVGEYEESQISTVEENGGEVSESGNIDWKELYNAKLGNLALSELSDELNIIDLTEFEPFLDSLIESLYDDVGNMTGNDLDNYDDLLSVLEDLK